jgi:hypothetical protein
VSSDDATFDSAPLEVDIAARCTDVSFVPIGDHWGALPQSFLLSSDRAVKQGVQLAYRFHYGALQNRSVWSF